MHANEAQSAEYGVDVTLFICRLLEYLPNGTRSGCGAW